jgi:hypothetical protein
MFNLSIASLKSVGGINRGFSSISLNFHVPSASPAIFQDALDDGHKKPRE